jgi:hypothetical protein
MPKFSKPKMIHNKGSRQAYLPSRKALNQILKGDPVQRSLGNYAKLTPSGAAGMQQPYSDITNLGVQPSIMPAIKDEE